jgi:hypothetical protein
MAGMRLMALGLTPEKVSISVPSSGHGVWGAVTDISLDRGTATIVFFVDGTASLYISSGGGILGGQSHEAVRRAGTALLDSLEASYASLHRGEPGSPPAAGKVRFSVHARDGLFVSGDLDANELATGNQPLSSAFARVNDLLTALRQIEASDG